jgi:hypothetical protein
MTAEQVLRSSIEHVHGASDVSYGENELIVLCLVRDGRPYVEPFVEHYFSLGVKHIVFLDNNSSDGTVEALEKYDNVTVLRTKLPYKGNQGFMRLYLIARFGKDRWSLSVDIDELFDYPYSDVIGLDSLLGYLNSKSYTAVTAHMLDMFPEKPLSDQAGEPDRPLKELHRFYDIDRARRDTIKWDPHILRNNTLESDDIQRFSGGIRATVFGFWPGLTKWPLVFSNGRIKPACSGSLHAVDNAAIADFTCVLFHYKFLEHFREQTVRAVKEENYYNNSVQYKKYLEVLDRNPSLRVKQETSREIDSVNDLLENQFLVVSDDYVSWVDAEEEKRVLLQAPQSERRELAEAFLESRRREREKTLRIQRLGQQRRDRDEPIRDRDGMISLRDEMIRERDETIRRLKQNHRRLKRQSRRRKQQLERMQASRTWKLAKMLRLIKTRVASLGRGRS